MVPPHSLACEPAIHNWSSSRRQSDTSLAAGSPALLGASLPAAAQRISSESWLGNSRRAGGAPDPDPGPGPGGNAMSQASWLT